MSDKHLPSLGDNSFEGLKQTNAHGAEYWSARDLQPLPGYSQWRRFEQAIERAITSCEKSGNSPNHHFAGAGKPITGGLARDDIKVRKDTCPNCGSDRGCQGQGPGHWLDLGTGLT